MPRPWYVSSPKQLNPLPLSKTPRPQVTPHGFGSRTGFSSHPSTGGLQTEGLLQIQLCQTKLVPCAPTVSWPVRALHSLSDTTSQSKKELSYSHCSGQPGSFWQEEARRRTLEHSAELVLCQGGPRGQAGGDLSSHHHLRCMSAPCLSWRGSGTAVPAELRGQ